MTAPLLHLQGFGVSFGAQPVVQGVDLQLAAGERLALVGESGSGKSVTALALLGLLEGAQRSGQAWWADRAPPRDLLALDEAQMQTLRGDAVAMVFQEPMTALNPLMTVGQQIAEVLQLKKGWAARQAQARAQALLAEVGLPDPPQLAQRYPHQLSGGQRQRTLIAMALAGQPRLLLADEPTTALDAGLRLQMLALLTQLQARTGMAIVLITHDLALVRHFAQRVTVMERGRVVEQGPVAQVLGRPQHPYTQKLLASRPSRQDLVPTVPDAPAEITAQGLSVDYPVRRPGWRGWWRAGRWTALRPTDFQLHAGQTLGVMGESGSGKTTLAQAVLGLLPSRGQLRVAGQGWQGRAGPDRALRRRVQVVFQDPYGSLSPRRTVFESVAEGLHLHQPDWSPAQIRAQVQATLAEVGLPEQAHPGLLERYPHAFSGGQRQRIALARALVVQPQVLVLDEPTSALDVTVQAQILALLQRLQRERGMAYLLITHDLDVLRAMAHQVLVLREGQVVEAGSAEQVLTQARHPYTQSLLQAFGAGHGAPA